MLPFGRSAGEGGPDVVYPSDDAQAYRALIDFWMAPFMFLRTGNIVYLDKIIVWSRDGNLEKIERSGQRWVSCPCGYYDGDDVEAEAGPAEAANLVQKGWLEEVPRKKRPDASQAH